MPSVSILRRARPRAHATGPRARSACRLLFQGVGDRQGPALDGAVRPSSLVDRRGPVPIATRTARVMPGRSRSPRDARDRPPDARLVLFYVVHRAAVLFVAGTSWSTSCALSPSLFTLAWLSLTPWCLWLARPRRPGSQSSSPYQVHRRDRLPAAPVRHPKTSRVYHRTSRRSPLESGQKGGRGANATSDHATSCPSTATDFIFAAVGDH